MSPVYSRSYKPVCDASSLDTVYYTLRVLLIHQTTKSKKRMPITPRARLINQIANPTSANPMNRNIALNISITSILLNFLILLLYPCCSQELLSLLQNHTPIYVSPGLDFIQPKTLIASIFADKSRIGNKLETGITFV